MRTIFFVLLGLLAINSTSWAQNLPAATRGVDALRHSRSALQQLDREAPLVLGNYKIGFSSPTMKLFAPYLQERFFEHRLDPVDYPETSAHDNIRILKSLHRFAGDATRLEFEFSRINAQIQHRIFTGEIAYKNFLPQDIDVLYIGEIHDETRIQQEIVSLVKQLPSIYPNRHIYLAAEVVPTQVEWSVEKGLSFTLNELAEQLDIAAPIKSIQVVTAALDVHIPVYGLEDEIALAVASIPSKSDWPTEDQFDRYATSLEGLHFRNKLFARRIRALQAYDPGALIVVYGGIDHIAYHNVSALPSMIKGKSFVVQVTVPSALGASNPLFSAFEADEPIRQQFHSSPDAKLLESWKTPGYYNKLFGNDLTVIVHE